MLLRADRGGGASRLSLVGRGGVVGRRLPPLHSSSASISPGDLLVLATDGIHPDFAHQVTWFNQPQRVADSILAGHRTGADDALVLAVLYRGAIA